MVKLGDIVYILCPKKRRVPPVYKYGIIFEYLSTHLVLCELEVHMSFEIEKNQTLSWTFLLDL